VEKEVVDIHPIKRSYKEGLSSMEEPYLFLTNCGKLTNYEQFHSISAHKICKKNVESEKIKVTKIEKIVKCFNLSKFKPLLNKN